ncbi:NAD-dependent epimerase/dehydratase family protein [Qipengyuania sediminis]|uniref:NAD-dependent epimerase/dehydratase family protein n=1 Tax=Qipengyuania sediminis TaxID=1532023 RepID=UPI001059403A|nr:NAD(P)-dependent oxidoreductase [Qipengyuania sediminis]
MVAVLALTGATGFVGQAVLDEAARRGRPVQALTRRPQEPRSGVTWIAGDLDERAALAELVTGASALLHVAARTTAPSANAFEAANVRGTEAVLEAAAVAGVRRFVFVSSLSAREPGLSMYGASKAQAERLVAASGLDWTVVRPPGVYGPRDVDYLEMFRAAQLGVVPIPPRGASSLIHVQDLARLLLDLTDAPLGRVRHKLYEPDDGREGGWSHRELAHLIGEAVGRRVMALPLPAPLLRLAARCDELLRGSKARLTADRVGYLTHPNWVSRSAFAVPPDIWRPSIESREGLVRTAAWYRANGLLR